MAATQRIIDLRKLLAERFQQQPTLIGEQINVPLLERTLEGGLRKGAIIEIINPNPSAGSALLIHNVLQIAQRDRFFLALIDGSDSLDVYDSGALPHLLWVRCEKANEAVKAADFLLRDGNFPLVILDLVLNPADELRRKLDESRAIANERDEFESAEVPVDKAEPGIDERRRSVHERAQASIEDMRDSPAD